MENNFMVQLFLHAFCNDLKIQFLADSHWKWMPVFLPEQSQITWNPNLAEAKGIETTFGVAS